MVSKTLQRSQTTGSVKDRARPRRPQIITNEENSLNVKFDCSRRFKKFSTTVGFKPQRN